MATHPEPVAVVDLVDGRSVELHDARRQAPGEYGVGAYHDGELVGLLVCEADDLGNGHLNVFVKPEWRSIGVGAGLVRHMTDWAATQGLAYLTLSFAVGNDAASRMLAATGLVIARRVRDGVEKAAVYVPRARGRRSEPRAAAA